MRRMLHPNAVSTVRMEGKPLGDQQIRSVHLFLTVYVVLFTLSCLLLSLEKMDLVTIFTSVATCINNVGPGLEVVGPLGNFSSFSPWSKLLLSFDMLVGRLEIFPMLLLFAPSVWKRRSGAQVREPGERPAVISRCMKAARPKGRAAFRVRMLPAIPLAGWQCGRKN